MIAHLFLALRFPLGLICGALLIQLLAEPYMQWASANQAGAEFWIPAAGLLLAVGIGLMLSTIVLSLVGAAVYAVHKALSTVIALWRARPFNGS